jgi:hypothetical protein
VCKRKEKIQCKFGGSSNFQMGPPKNIYILHVIILRDPLSDFLKIFKKKTKVTIIHNESQIQKYDDFYLIFSLTSKD